MKQENTNEKRAKDRVWGAAHGYLVKPIHQSAPPSKHTHNYTHTHPQLHTHTLILLSIVNLCLFLSRLTRWMDGCTGMEMHPAATIGRDVKCETMFVLIDKSFFRLGVAENL